MTVASMAFYMFALFTLLGGTMVIFARSSVHSVLFLIFTFMNVTGLLLILGAEFLAFLLAIVYVGAVAVLFLFVVMMMSTTGQTIAKFAKAHFVTASLIGGAFMVELLFVLFTWSGDKEGFVIGQSALGGVDAKTNSHALATILYTDAAYLFQIAGVILLVAMVGGMILTIRRRVGVKKQSIRDQVNLKPKEAVEMKTMPKGEGI